MEKYNVKATFCGQMLGKVSWLWSNDVAVDDGPQTV